MLVGKHGGLFKRQTLAKDSPIIFIANIVEFSGQVNANVSSNVLWCDFGHIFRKRPLNRHNIQGGEVVRVRNEGVQFCQDPQEFDSPVSEALVYIGERNNYKVLSFRWSWQISIGGQRMISDFITMLLRVLITYLTGQWFNF